MTIREKIILYSAFTSAGISVGSFFIYPHSPIFGIVFMVSALLLLAYIINSSFERVFGQREIQIQKYRLDEYLQKLIDEEKALKEQRSAILNVLGKVEKEKEKITEERDKIHTILHSIADGIVVLEKSGKISLFNDSAAEMTGLSKMEAEAEEYQTVIKIVNEKGQEILTSLIEKTFSTGEPQRSLSDVYLVNKRKQRVPVALSISPIKDLKRETTAVILIVQDVSKKKEVERAKLEFISLASHQLRTPLSTINWYTEMLLDGDMGQLNKDQYKALQEVQLANQKTLDLVNSLLNMSRINMGTLAVSAEATNLSRLTETALSELAPQIKAKKIEIEKDYDKNLKSVIIDSKLFYIIVENLLSNAVKYSKEKGTVIIKIKTLPSGATLFSVKDFGCGIPPADQPSIFRKLFRAENAKALDPEGNGLGLYIVKSIADKTGLKVWFTSEEGKGSEFFVEIPEKGMKRR